jgi:hypothetical protein
MYIERDIPLRSLLFARNEVQGYLQFLQRQLEMDIGLRQEIESEIKKCENQIKEYDREIMLTDRNLRIPQGSRWSGKQIEQMARDVGLRKEFSGMYWLISGISHSTGTASHLYLTFNDKGGLSPNFYPNDSLSKEIARGTAYVSFRVLNVVDRNVKLGKSRGIEQLRKKIECGFWKAVN